MSLIVALKDSMQTASEVQCGWDRQAATSQSPRTGEWRAFSLTACRWQHGDLLSEKPGSQLLLAAPVEPRTGKTLIIHLPESAVYSDAYENCTFQYFPRLLFPRLRNRDSQQLRVLVLLPEYPSIPQTWQKKSFCLIPQGYSFTKHRHGCTFSVNLESLQQSNRVSSVVVVAFRYSCMISRAIGAWNMLLRIL